GRPIGIPPDFSIVSEQESLELIKSSIQELGLDSRQFQPSHIQNLICQKKSKGGTFEDSEEKEDFFSEKLKEILENYEERLRLKNALDFDDLIKKTLFLFENFPAVLKFYQEKWSFIHIDEYQDTDPLQNRLISLLGKHQQNICAVGDEDQSIYGFRGADFTNILNFEKEWPETKIITLERNYRSTQKILEAANAVIAKNSQRRPKNLYSCLGKGGKIDIFEAESEEEEGKFIARQIKNLLKKQRLDSPIAILCRTNLQFLPIEKALKEHCLPFQAATDQEALTREKAAIQLLTIHASKGLEFKYVFLPGLEKGLLPHLAGDKEEERRLFYVALTRAEEKIFISFSRFRKVFGSKQINQPSPFLSDIPKNLIKWL
ncbi:MAG: ATP-dependent helicase, partial [Minisyncoccales bacterium]